MSREVLSALRIMHVLKHNDVSGESGFTTTPSASMYKREPDHKALGIGVS
jgi:hypothetical protein